MTSILPSLPLLCGLFRYNSPFRGLVDFINTIAGVDLPYIP